MIRVSKKWLKFKILKWFIAMLGFVLSIYLAANHYRTQRKNITTQNNVQSERFLNRIEIRLRIYETLLSQTQAFFVTINKVSHKDFKKYYRNLRNFSQLYGIRGIGFSRYVPKNELPAFLREMRDEVPQYQIWPFEDKEEYFPIMFLEPPSFFNDSVLGFDISTERNRFLALSRAWQTGETTMSGRVNFVRSLNLVEKDLGFILLRPVYKEIKKKDHFTKKNLNGFIYAPFIYNDFLSKTSEDFSDLFDYQVFEYHPQQEIFLIFQSQENISHENMFSKKYSFLGQSFLFKFYPKADYKVITNSSIIILLIGLSLTLLIIKVLNDTIKTAEQSSLNEKNLEESLRARDEFISIASHELKTPLTSLKLRAQISKRKLSKDKLSLDGFNEFVDEIEKHVVRLERLVNDILDITRIRTGNFSFQPDPFNFCHLIEDVIIRVRLQFASCLPPIIVRPCNEIIVNWDRMRIEQVLTNLLTNAIKYGKGSPIKIDIQISNKDIIFSVSDKGIGIEPQFTEMIFNRFERAGISPNEISGLGLGLFITHRIVSDHKGKIWVESVKNEGSTFHVKMAKDPFL